MAVIEWGDFASVQQGIVNGNNAIQGAPAQNVPQITGARPWLTESGIEYFNFESAGSGDVGINTNFPGTSASQASQQYINSGGHITQGGAASQSGNVVKAANYTLTQKSSQAGTGLMSVGALLSVNLPTAAAAIAPIAGVALGAGLYSLNPGLWENISRALLPFCYEDTELLPVVADESGNTYFPLDALNAVKDVLTGVAGVEANAGDTDLAAYVSPVPFNFYTNVTYCDLGKTSYGKKYEIHIRGNDHVSVVPYTAGPYIGYVLASIDAFGVKIDGAWSGNLGQPNDVRSVIQPGSGFWYSFLQTDTGTGFSLPGPITIHRYDSVTPFVLAADAMVYGSSEKYPEGVSKWLGVQYPLNLDGIGLVTRISEDGQIVTTNPYYPLTMPVGEPGVSPNPVDVPQPGKNTEVNPAIDPWIPSSPAPTTYPAGEPQSDPSKLPNPVPSTDPKLDPGTNPSEVPEPQPGQEPIQFTKPENIGTTIPPIIPAIPVLPSAATGLLHVYNPTQSQIDAFGSWLWSTFSGDLIDTVSKLFNDPMDAVIGLHELYATPSISGLSTIRAGFLDSGVASNLVGSRYTSINCGSIVVQEYYQNYLDYSPYTKCYIYLPFIGIVSVLADDIIGNAVNVTYHIDSYTGCCIAVITVARSGYSSTVYQFEGNCAVEIPVTSGYQSTLMGALIGVGATALTGNPHAGIAAASMGRASLGKNDVSHSGSFGSSYGAMGAKIPYIIVKRPTQKTVINYNQDYGFPAHKRVVIGACSGYLRAREVHVISPTATDDEKARIEELLKQGVFVK